MTLDVFEKQFFTPWCAHVMNFVHLMCEILWFIITLIFMKNFHI